LLICTGVWELLSFILLIIYLRWQRDHSAARDEPEAAGSVAPAVKREAEEDWGH
jgi:hypothetical protein